MAGVRGDRCAPAREEAGERPAYSFWQVQHPWLSQKGISPFESRLQIFRQSDCDAHDPCAVGSAQARAGAGRARAEVAPKASEAATAAA